MLSIAIRNKWTTIHVIVIILWCLSGRFQRNLEIHIDHDIQTKSSRNNKNAF